jgi:signal transduction histidine kinase
VRLSERIPAVLLGLATVFGGVGVVEAWRAAHSNRATAEALLRDYGAMAAWTFAERMLPELDEAIRSAFMPIWRQTGSGSPGPFADVAEFRRRALGDDCGCDHARFQAAYHFRLRPGAGAPVFAGAAPDAGTGAALASAVVADAPRLIESMRARDEHGLAQSVRMPFRIVSAGGSTVAYTLHAAGNNGVTAWGFSLDSTAVSARAANIITACALLPPVLTTGRPNHEMLAIALIAPDGSTLFAAGAPDASLAAQHRLGERYGGLLIRASVLPALANDLIIGGLPRSRVPLMFGVFALAVVLAGVAIAQLRRAQELARLRSEFVAGVSHELRTPLAQIRIYVDTLAMGRASSASRRVWSLDGLRRETARLEHLVDNILQSARDTRCPPGAGEVVDLGEEAGRAIDAFRPLAARRASLELVTNGAIPVRIAPESLRQVLGNLIDNAVKYGPRGQVVRVAINAVGGNAQVMVDDEGPGIAAAERDLVWEIYRRGTNAASGEVGGSGIGLAVVRRIVEAHGGCVAVSSAEHGGARFVVELPLAAHHAAASPGCGTPVLVGAGAE